MAKIYIALDTSSVIASGSSNDYVAFLGASYTIEQLRAWANDTWSTPLDASLEVIAKDIKQGGWMLFEGIEPTV